MVAALLGLTLVVLLVHDIPLANYLRTVERDRIITSLERDSFIIAGNSAVAVAVPSATHSAELDALLANYKATSEAVVLVTDKNGVIVAATDPKIKPGDSFSSRPEIETALGGEVASGERYSQTLNYRIFYVAVPILAGKHVLGTVRVTFPSSVVDDIVASRLRGIAIVASITLILALLVALVLATSVTKRLRNLQEVTEKFSDGDYETRADVSTGASEIKSLARSFNKMADQLTRLLEQQRAFAADASHQLRTPLTALQLRLERVVELINSDPNGANERLEAAMVETDRLQNVVEGLLVLSRASAELSPELHTYNIANIAAERVTNWSALASESNVKIEFEGPQTALVLAVPGALEQVIDNFIDNALEIVVAETTITVRIDRAFDTTTLHVLDEGPGLPEEDLEKAFNRFWRARSDANGSGLGLAIVERLVTASGGQVKLENRHPHGLDASATFNNAEK